MGVKIVGFHGGTGKGCGCCGSPSCSWLCGTSVTFAGGGCTSAPTGTVTLSGGVVTGVTVTDPGAGCTSAPTVVFHGAGTGAAATATLGGGVVTGVTVGNQGTDYTAVPTVTFSGPGGGGVTATGTAVLAGGGVTGTTITGGGAGYTATPGVTFSAPTLAGGATATGTATLTGGVVTGITITSPGSLYTSTPTVTIDAPPMGGTQATATAAIATIGVGSITITSPGSLYYSAPSVTIGGPGGGGITATATATVSAVGVASVSVTSGGSGYVDGSSPPSILYVTIVSPIATYGTWGLILNNPAFGPHDPAMEAGYCYWSLVTTADFPGTSLEGAVTGVPVTIWYRSDSNILGLAVGGADGSYTCAGGSFPPICSGAHVNGCIVGNTYNNTQNFLGVGLPACTSRPYSATFAASLSWSTADLSELQNVWVFLGGTCSDTAPALTITVSE